MKKKKMLILAGKLAATGGIETHLLNYCRYLNQDILITIVVSSSNSLLNFKREQISHNGLIVKEFNCIGKSITAKINYFALILYAIFKRLMGFDILYTNGGSGDLAYFLGFFLKFKNWVHHHHSDISEKTICAYTPNYINIFYKANHVILCTEQQRLNFVNFDFKSKPVFLPYCKQEYKAFLQKKKFKGNLTFMGRILISKGIKFILELDESWLSMHNLKCKIYGNLELNANPEVEQKVTTAKGRIHYKGVYDADKDLDIILNDTDIVLIPSIGAEGLPLVFTEAIARGIPVVAFDGGGLRDYAEFDEGVLISEPNVEIFKANILKMSHRILTIDSLSRNLKQKYDNNLSSDITLNWWKKF